MISYDRQNEQVIDALSKVQSEAEVIDFFVSEYMDDKLGLDFDAVLKTLEKRYKSEFEAKSNLKSLMSN